MPRAEGAAFGDRKREGFFDVDILAVAHGVDGDEGVPVVGRADEDDIDVGAAVELAKIGVGFAVGVAVSLIDAGRAVFTTGAVNIAHGDDAEGFR